MRDDDVRRVLRGWAAAVAVATALPVAGRAEAQVLHGLGEVQYQRVEGVRSGSLRETWIKSFETDYSRRLPGAVDLAARVRFTEQTVVGQPDRLRAPEGTLRLAHRYLGVSSAYRPSNVRDSGGRTTRQQNLTLTGYAQKPGLPSLSGSWVRTHLDSSAQAQGSATVTRSLSAVYTVPKLGLRAGYGDRILEPDGNLGSRLVDKHLNLGSVSQFQLGVAPVSLQYDFTQGWANPSGLRAQRSRAHTASGSGSFQWSPKTASSLIYTYRRAGVVGEPGTLTQDHNGSLTISHALIPAWSVSGGVGVRSAIFGGRTLTERFVTAGTAAQGQARPGWRVGAAAGRTLNWLPGARVRTTDSFSSNTLMRLARGLEVRGDFSASATERPEATVDSIPAGREVGLQFGAGVAATPLRTVFMDASAHRSRAGASPQRGSSTSTSYAASLRLAPSARLHLGGGWSLIRGFGSRGTTVQATAVWSPGSRVQATGSYSRARQEVSNAAVAVTSRQESFAGSLALALARNLNGSVRYSESYRGQPSQIRQVSVNLVRRFGR